MRKGGISFSIWGIILLLLQTGGLPLAQSARVSPIAGSPAGAPFIRNYSPEAYDAHNQNWAIVQDERGVMYAGNNYGVLEYDGVSWQLFPVANRSNVRSLAVGAGGRVYVGSFGEIGYLAPDTLRRLRYVSLLSQIEEPYRDFADVWQTLAIGSQVFFVTQKYIFRWDGRRMRRWEARESFHIGFSINETFYVRQREVGLMHLVADSLVLAPLGEAFAGDRISAMLPYAAGGEGRILLATRTNGLLLYDGRSLARFPTEVDAQLKEAQIYCAIPLAGGGYAIGTLQSGVFVLDERGRLRHHLHKATGLQDDTVYFLYADRQGGLWIAMHVGVSRAEIASPHTFFAEREGLEGSALDITRHEGRLYVATSMGIYYLDEGPGAPHAPGRFRRVTGVSPQCWALLPFGKTLLAGAFDGVYEIRAGSARKIDGAYAMSLHRSRQDTNRVFVGMQDGLKILRYNGGQWRDEGRIEGVVQEIRGIHETPGGQLWLTALNNGLLMADLSKGFSRRPFLMRYDTLHGLPGNERSLAFTSSRGMRFATQRGIFRFDDERQYFFPDTTLITGLPDARNELFTVSEDRRGNLWLVATEKSRSGVAMRQAGGAYRWWETPFLRIAGISSYYAYPDPLAEGVTWLGCIDRVIRHDGNAPQDETRGWPTLIRQVIANGDSLIFGGAPHAPRHIFRLRYADNSLRFRYAAPGFGDESKTQYQHRLEGYDDDWSHWTTETYKDFTGLPPGTYRFLVRSKNIYRQIGDPAVWQFRVLPPFYLTWWAWLVYTLLLAGSLVALWRYSTERLRRRHLREMKQLEYEKLKELDQLKSRFFADITHEFRTPLTLILGPIDRLLASQPDQEHSHQYQLIRRNAQRLLRLINQLLDLSKLEAGKMTLEREYTDMIPLLRGITNAFESLMQNKDVRLRFDSETERAVLNVDRDRMEQILTNLISNAVKFTPRRGEVRIGVKRAGTAERLLQIDVANTGPGIPAAQLPHVFERFYQGDEATRIDEPGSGIGLALTKELVELHGGRISVSSREGQGARFRILLPWAEELPATEPGPPAASHGVVLPGETAGDTPPALSETPEPDMEHTLLLVEDNPDMRSFLRESLAGDYRVIEAADGQDGVEKAIEHIPDLIISDVMMPRRDGLQLCDILKHDERTSHIPIVLLTARADIESRLAGLERGADDYLAKPFYRDELLLRARNLLTWRRRLRERYASLQPPAPAEDRDTRIEDAFLQKIRSIAEQHLADPEFEIDRLARLAGMSRSQLFRKVKALTGQSPSLFIRAIRLQRAMELLRSTGMNVSEVAYDVGFSTPGYFSDAFMEVYGVRPSQVRG